MTDEEKLKAQQDVLKAQQRELLKKLQAIGSDFWGGAASGNSTREDNDTERKNAEKDRSGFTSAGQEQPGQTDVTGRPAVTIENLWMTADETVDWTEALAHEWPADGLTRPALWQFYHEQAEKVLSGDVQAYAAVLRRINPLGDLTGYADGLTMRAPSAERLEGQFTCRGDYLKQYGKKYLAAMGLRIARDLLATLPVSEVGVTAYNEGRLVLEATYSRESLRHAAFRFTDPVALTEQCGGKM